jgi:hypothetical protein
MGADARELGQQHADVLRALRDFHPKELLYGQAKGEVVGKRGEIIDPVGNRDRLRIGERLSGFFDPGVKIADVGIRFDYRFPVQFQHHAEHAVGGRMLGPHVEDHGPRGTRSGLYSGHGAGSIRRLPETLDGIVFAEWMPFPVVGHQQAPQVGVPLEVDTK